MKRLIIVLLIALAPACVAAFSATSTSFFVRQTISTLAGTSTDGYSTSTSFKLLPSAAQQILGISTSSSSYVRAGFLNTLNRAVKPTYTQIHYHFRYDDGSETTATSRTSGTEDTTVSNINKGSNLRLRFNISNEGGTQYLYSAQTFRLEFGTLVTSCSAIVTWTQVGSNGTAWITGDSTNLTNAANTTDIALASGGVSNTNATFLTSNGGVRDTSSETDALSLSSDSFVELEYSIKADTSATDGATYCFRVTNAGSTTNFSYSVYPQATITSSSLTFAVDSNSQTLPSLTPGTLVATTSILTAKTGNSSGFTISAIRDTAAATLQRSGDVSVTISDKSPDWIAPGSTASAGNGTASTTQTQSLQFRIRLTGTDAANYASAWWGSADTSAGALFAGIPSTTQVIVNRASSAAATTTAYVLYNIDVPATQKNGTYTGSVTYTAVVNP